VDKRILVVDDDNLIRESVGYNLEQAGYQVETAANAEEALSQAKASPPDLILLDIGLPGMDGMEALHHLRLLSPVIFVTARRRELDEILGLEMGAEDYITKPFACDVLLARVRAVLRRMPPGKYKSSAPLPLPLTLGDVTIDPRSHTIMVAGTSVSLAPREFRLLHLLAMEANRVIPAEELLTRVWGAEYNGEDQIVYVYIRQLRLKIEKDPKRPVRIVTVRGVGYKFVPQEQ
jgi:DNA-binding response OmpR family regulator